MLDFQTIQKYDQSEICNVYDQWPKFAKESYESSMDHVDFKNIKEIIFVGMGGSGTIGDVFSSILSKTKIHVSVVKGYHVPSTVTSESLVILTSISGNTSETLSVLDSTKTLGCKILAFSSGGKMEDYCEKNNLQHRKIPQIHSPRASFPSYLFSMLKVLEPIVQIKKEDIQQSLIELDNLSKKISLSNLTDTNPSLSLAEWISNMPLIYYPWGLQSAAIRFKNSLQENSKSHVIIEDVIEACHNGIVAWEKKSTVQPILLQGMDDHIKTKERWSVIKQFFKENEIEYREIFSVKGSILAKILCLIYLLDYCTIYRAILSKIDPTPIKPIDFIKSKVSDNS